MATTLIKIIVESPPPPHVGRDALGEPQWQRMFYTYYTNKEMKEAWEIIEQKLGVNCELISYEILHEFI